MQIKLPPIKVPIRRKRTLSNGVGFTTDTIGYELLELVAYIDETALAHALGPKASLNKSGRAKLQGGAVEVRVVGRAPKLEAA